MSTFNPIGSLSSSGLRMRVCMCLCIHSTGIVRKELVGGYANAVHTSSSFCPHTLIPFEDRKLTGLKVDFADIPPYLCCWKDFITDVTGSHAGTERVNQQILNVLSSSAGWEDSLIDDTTARSRKTSTRRVTGASAWHKQAPWHA